MSAKVLVAGEGPNDHGRREWNVANAEYLETEGWLQPILRRLLGDKGPIEFFRVERSALVSLPRKSPKAQLSGHGKKARIALNKAEREGYDMVVFMADADSNKAKDWQVKNKQILQAIGDGDQKARLIACVPMSASESWLLSDWGAWKALGLDDGALLPKEPEKLWGARNDPDGNHPHQIFSRVCASVDVEDGTDVRADIADKIDLVVLSKACQTSFPPFRNLLTEQDN